MEPDCKMSLHRYYTCTPAEPLGVHELVLRGAASVTFDESSCRTYHTGVFFRSYVSVHGVSGCPHEWKLYHSSHMHGESFWRAVSLHHPKTSKETYINYLDEGDKIKYLHLPLPVVSCLLHFVFVKNREIKDLLKLGYAKIKHAKFNTLL